MFVGNLPKNAVKFSDEIKNIFEVINERNRPKVLFCDDVDLNDIDKYYVKRDLDIFLSMYVDGEYLNDHIEELMCYLENQILINLEGVCETINKYIEDGEDQATNMLAIKKTNLMSKLMAPGDFNPLMIMRNMERTRKKLYDGIYETSITWPGVACNNKEKKYNRFIAEVIEHYITMTNRFTKYYNYVLFQLSESINLLCTFHKGEFYLQY